MLELIYREAIETLQQNLRDLPEGNIVIRQMLIEDIEKQKRHLEEIL